MKRLGNILDFNFDAKNNSPELNYQYSWKLHRFIFISPRFLYSIIFYYYSNKFFTSDIAFCRENVIRLHRDFYMINGFHIEKNNIEINLMDFDPLTIFLKFFLKTKCIQMSYILELTILLCNGLFDKNVYNCKIFTIKLYSYLKYMFKIHS